MFDNLRENFELILIVLLLCSTLAYIGYRLTFYKGVKADLFANRKALANSSRKEKKALRYNINASHINTPFRKFVFFFADLFWVLLFVVVMRSFIFEPFIIPSGSMKPGLQIGDIVLVNKFEKGLRLPVTNQRLTAGNALERGDVIVFKYPNNPKQSYIKRLIGLPGDKIHYDNRGMTINGKPIVLRTIREERDDVKVRDKQTVIEKSFNFTVFEENLLGKKHHIRYAQDFSAGFPTRDWVVPEGKYLMLGDNRDQSSDGRDWGYVEDKLIIGKASHIVFNFKCLAFKGQCDRFFKTIQ